MPGGAGGGGMPMTSAAFFPVGNREQP